VRAWRELIKLKAVRTEEGRGPGRVRICDRTNLKRSAVISALHQAGFSLAVAGPIALFLPYHTLLYEVCDPITILVRHSTEIDPKTGAPRADPLCIAAEAALRSPVFKTTINPTLAIRKALRRYLGIEPVLTKSEIEKSR
jgi:hypothetical protein